MSTVDSAGCKNDLQYTQRKKPLLEYLDQVDSIAAMMRRIDRYPGMAGTQPH